jgi:uncharacterized membrane protein
MWAPVLAANVVAVILALALPRLDEALSEDLPITLSTAEQMFGAIAAGMITFTGIVFSAVLVAAQIQTSAYSPRLAARLRRDGVVIASLALSTATASYALVALAAVGRQSDRLESQSAPAVTVLLALVLALLTFGGFVALVQRAFDSTQIGGILRGLLRSAHRVIEDVHGGRAAEPGELASLMGEDEPQVTVLHSGRPGVVASVDREALARLARETGSFVEVVPMVGRYITPGQPVLRLRGTRGQPDPGLAHRVLVLARQRTVDQDPAFVLRMLVDVAIRGLSPAVNDPTTAVQAIDRIEAILVQLHGHSPGPSLVRAADGEPLGVVPAPTWDAYLNLALMEIRHYGAGSAQVARRLHALHEQLLEIADESQRGRIELERELLAKGLAGHFPDEREREILSRADRLGLGGRA